ncbi:hypothetical protein WJX79_008850 [Trebouxia sp. C0005]
MAALDLFEGSLVQQSVEEERVLMPLPSYIHPQGQDLGPSAAMLSTEADASLNISTEPEADEVFLEKTNKPKALLRISSSVVDFTIKAFRLSNNVEVPNNNNEEQQAAASEREQIGAKVKKKMAVRFVPVALGGSPRLYVTPSGLIGLTEQADC